MSLNEFNLNGNRARNPMRNISGGRGLDPNVYRTKTAADAGTAGEALVFHRLMERIGELEQTDTYREMCDAAAESRAAEAATPKWGNGQNAGLTPAPPAYTEWISPGRRPPYLLWGEVDC